MGQLSLCAVRAREATALHHQRRDSRSSAPSPALSLLPPCVYSICIADGAGSRICIYNTLMPRSWEYLLNRAFDCRLYARRRVRHDSAKGLLQQSVIDRARKRISALLWPAAHSFCFSENIREFPRSGDSASLAMQLISTVALHLQHHVYIYTRSCNNAV